MSKLKKRLLGKLLNLANRQNRIYKTRFYPIKEKILGKHGTFKGLYYQHIKKMCWTCGGTGIFTNYYKTEECWDCHKGIYDEYYVRLYKFELGGFEFFIPGGRIGMYQPLFEGKSIPIIEGRIKHEAPKNNWGEEAMLWLFLFYNFKAFTIYFCRMRTIYGKRPPLVLISHIIMTITNKIENLYYQLKVKNDESDLVEDDLPF